MNVYLSRRGFSIECIHECAGKRGKRCAINRNRLFRLCFLMKLVISVEKKSRTILGYTVTVENNLCLQLAIAEGKVWIRSEQDNDLATVSDHFKHVGCCQRASGAGLIQLCCQTRTLLSYQTAVVLDGMVMSAVKGLLCITAVFSTSFHFVCSLYYTFENPRARRKRVIDQLP